MISREEIKHVAHLAKLSFDEESLDKVTPEIQGIIELVEHLQEVDTENVEPTFHGNNLQNVYREDEAVQNEDYHALINNAPSSQDGYIQVPVIIEEGEGA